jgi:hypothetical protein
MIRIREFEKNDDTAIKLIFATGTKSEYKQWIVRILFLWYLIFKD